jgi:hypothetical protein
VTIKVSNKAGLSLDEIQVFLKASEGVHFEGERKEEVYAWVNGSLGEQHWDELGRTARGLVRRYLEKMTGVSRAQITRLITQYGEDGGQRPKLMDEADAGIELRVTSQTLFDAWHPN